MERTDPALAADEPTMLGQYLDYHRATLVTKLEGLDRAGLAATVGRSEMTLAGLVKHLALVEDWWFTVVMMDRPEPEPWLSAPTDDDPDWEWHSALDDTLDALLAQYATSCERSRAVVAEVGDLDALSARESSREPGQRFSLRWIMVHMIEETARHVGHADLLRESVDGLTGE